MTEGQATLAPDKPAVDPGWTFHGPVIYRLPTWMSASVIRQPHLRGAPRLRAVVGAVSTALTCSDSPADQESAALLSDPCSRCQSVPVCADFVSVPCRVVPATDGSYRGRRANNEQTSMINPGRLVILSRPGSRAISGAVDSSLLLAA